MHNINELIISGPEYLKLLLYRVNIEDIDITIFKNIISNNYVTKSNLDFTKYDKINTASNYTLFSFATPDNALVIDAWRLKDKQYLICADYSRGEIKFCEYFLIDDPYQILDIIEYNINSINND